MILHEIIQRIQSLYSKGVQSDDTRLSSRHIYSKIKTVRSKLISEKSNKKQHISQWNYQTLNCVELVTAPKHECPCTPATGCTILKTKYPLPNPLINLNGHLIQSVTSLEGSIIYSETNWEEKKYKKFNKYTGNKPDYFIRNNHLYITHKNGSKLITITGLFDDPVEALNYPSYCNKDCTDCDECSSPLDMEFPMDNDDIDTLVTLTAQELIVLFNQNIEDLTNDSKDSNIQQSK